MRHLLSPVHCLTLLLALALSFGPASSAEPHRSLTVTGHGESHAVPDIATLQIGVETQGETPGEAMTANAERMTKVMARLKDSGIAAKDLQTSQLSIWPIHDNSSSGRARLTVGYQVSNQLSVTIRDLAGVGSILDKTVTDGANTINGPTFSVADPKPLLEKARDAAVADAIAKAERYAKTAGVVLGEIISIDEGGGAVPVMARQMRTQAMEAATPVAVGETAFSATVRMVFAIGGGG